MPLTIALTDSEVDTVRYACKNKKDISLEIRSRQLTLSKTNLIPIRQAVNELFKKKLAVKTKNGEHLEMIFNAPRIIGKIDGVAGQLGQVIEEEETDDNEFVEEPVDSSVDEISSNEDEVESDDYNGGNE